MVSPALRALVTETRFVPAAPRPEVADHEDRGRQERLPLVGAVLIGVAFTLLATWLESDLFGAEPTIDESFSRVMATWSPTALVNGMPADPHMVTYHAVLFVWSWIVGDSMEALRSLSVVSLGAAVSGTILLAGWYGRRGWAVAAVAGLLLTPVTREALIDAKATAFAMAATVVMIALLLRLRSTPTAAWFTATAVAVLVVATSHPSSFPFAVAAMPVLFEARRPIARGNLLFGMVATPIAGLVAVLLRQGSEHVELVETDRLTTALAFFLGGSLLAALVVLATTLVVIGGRWHADPILSLQALAAVGWVVLSSATFMSGMSNLLYARYFGPAALVILLFLVGAVPAGGGWRPVIGCTLALVVVGGALTVSDAIRDPQMHCTVATDLATLAEPGDIIEFLPGSVRVSTFGCLGREGSTSLLAVADTIPAFSPAELDDPRAMWYGTARDPGVDANTSNRRLVIGTAELRAERVTELERGGFACSPIGRLDRIMRCTPTP